MATAATLVGLLAATITTGSTVPQVVKCWRTRSSGDLSLRSVSLLSFGLLLWIVYGLMEKDGVVAVANSVGLLLNLNLLGFKLLSEASV